MAMLIIRHLDNEVMTQLRLRARLQGSSVGEEAQAILRKALMPPSGQKGFGTRIHQRVMALTGGVELKLPERTAPRTQTTFGSFEK